MSHVVEIKTLMRDPAAISSACKRLGLKPPVQETVQLFNATVTGLAIAFPGWRYPVVCDITTGEVKFDNFQERWGERIYLDRFIQFYSIEKVKLEATRRGHTVSERELVDGSVKLTVQVNGEMS